MNKFQVILKWLSDNWKVVSGLIAAIIAALCTLFAVQSCGSVVKATIRTPKDGTSNAITISTNNPVEISPDVETSPTITITPKKYKKNDSEDAQRNATERQPTAGVYTPDRFYERRQADTSKYIYPPQRSVAQRENTHIIYRRLPYTRRLP